MEIQEPKTKQFQRNKEDFVCENCGAMNHGDGYTNHCSHCLVSRHVDNNPGDRAADCRGLMDVVDIRMDHGELIFTQRCRTCGYEKSNKAHPDDKQDAILTKMKEINKDK